MDSFNKNGYTLVKSFFLKDEIANVLNQAKGIFFRQFHYKRYLKNNQTLLEDISDEEFNNCLYRLFEEDLTCLSNCGKQVQHLISLHRLSLDERILLKLKDLGIKTPVISTRPVLYFNHPRLAKQKVFHTVDAHQDWRSMQGSLNSIVVWLPLISVDVSLGALQVLPGSHLRGLYTDHIENGFGMVALSESDKASMISVEVEQGDALFFSSFLVHASGENTSDTPRWSCHFRYNDLEEPTFIERKYAHPYLYKPSEELITANFPTVEDVQNVFK